MASISYKGHPRPIFIQVAVDYKTKKQAKVKSAETGVTISDTVRALLFAYLRDDPARAIVAEQIKNKT